MNQKKNKPHSVMDMIGEAVGDVVDAASVAATGSQLGVLELAAEEELSPAPAKRKRKTKLARKKKAVVVKSKKKTKKKRGVKRRRR
jgi:hypothetical protein